MRHRLIAVIAALLTGLCLPPPALAEEPRADGAERACVPHFPLRNGWMGGDAAYSVALPDGRILWLFGDTFIGPEEAGTRRKAVLIGNSIALSECSGGEWSLSYHWRQGEQGPAAVFIPPDAMLTTHEVRYWPLDGFVHDGDVYVFLSRVRTTDADSPLGFAIEGVDMARIEGWRGPTEDWRITYRPVLRGAPALPGAAVLARGDHVLLYTPLTGEEHPERPLALARLPYEKLNAPADHLQFLTREGSWAKGFDAQRARHIMERGATELSVHETREGGGFVAVLNEARFPSDRIVLRTAPAPEGPWTEEMAVEHIAERAGNGAAPASLFCYAAKAYEPASRGTTLMLTYVCNSTEADVLLNDLEIYRPRTRRVMLPEAP